jgi:hypothetical protein
MRRLVLAVIVVGSLMPGAASATGIPNAPQGGVNAPLSGDPVVFVGAPGSSAPDRRGSGPGQLVCTLNELGSASEPGAPGGPGAIVTAPVEGTVYFVVCIDQASNTIALVRQITYQAGVNVIDAPTLARQASRLLPLLYPSPSTAPPRASTQLVGVRTWLWIDPQDYRPVVASAAVPGLSVTATAEPSAVRWDMGDDTPVFSCNGPGTPYDPNRPDAEQTTTCGHSFALAGHRTVTVHIDWRITWRATNGATGTLGTISRGVTFPVVIEERQAVIER